MKTFHGTAKLYSNTSGCSDYQILKGFNKDTLIMLRGTFTIEELEQLTTAAKQDNLDFELPKTIKP